MPVSTVTNARLAGMRIKTEGKKKSLTLLVNCSNSQFDIWGCMEYIIFVIL